MIYIESELKELLKTNTGWISPDGNLITCETYLHKKAIIKLLKGSDTPIGQIFTKWYEEGLEYLSDAEESCNKDVEEYGGGWHNYEMAEERLENDIIGFAYCKGFVRLSIDPSDKLLFAEGTEKGLEINRSVVKELTDSIGCVLGKKFSLKIEKINVRTCECWE